VINWIGLNYSFVCFYIFFLTIFHQFFIKKKKRKEKKKIDKDSNIEIDRIKRRKMTESITDNPFLADEIIQEVKSDACVVRLEYKRLAALLELTFDNPEVTDILRKTAITQREKEENIICFNKAYEYHVIQGKKTFLLLTPTNSLALCWLDHLYNLGTP